MKVAVISGSRADYGLLRPTIAALRDDPRFELALLVSAMHLQEEHGMTIRELNRRFSLDADLDAACEQGLAFRPSRWS